MDAVAGAVQRIRLEDVMRLIDVDELMERVRSTITE